MKRNISMQPICKFIMQHGFNNFSLLFDKLKLKALCLCPDILISNLNIVNNMQVETDDQLNITTLVAPVL